MLTIAETAERLQSWDNILILTHIRPDGDTVGSAAGLCIALRQLGKQAFILRDSGTMISVTRVETTPDLRYAKVYVSFLEENKAADAMKGLKSAGGYLRREVGNDLKLRYTPELVWELDDSITYGAKMLKLINSLDTGSDEE